MAVFPYLRWPQGTQFFDSNGQPLALGSLTYAIAGGTAPQDTYLDNAATIPNANPLTLDGSGRLMTNVYLGNASNYKETLKDFNGATISPWPSDNIPGQNTAGTNISIHSPVATDRVQIDSSTGQPGVMFGATTTQAGVMTTDMFNRLFTRKPTNTRLTSGSSLTYTSNTNVVRIRVRMWGSGGGGGAALTNNGSNGNASSFASWTANGGGGGINGSSMPSASGVGGTGGTNGTGTLIKRIDGARGGAGQIASSNAWPGIGGPAINSIYPPFTILGFTGSNSQANSANGGAGGASGASNAGSGGGAGEYVEFWVENTTPGATTISATYTVGAAANGGAAGGSAGATSGSGLIEIEEYYA